MTLSVATQTPDATPDASGRPEAGWPPADTLAQLEREGYRFEFFQAIRLLAASRGGPQTVGGPEPRREAVRVNPDPAGVFPASDVRHVRGPARPSDPVQVEVGFGGLYGVDAALPAVFYERIATGHEDMQPLRDFLDLLGHRPYAQLWRAWARFRPEVRAASPGRRDVHAVRAAALAGATETSETPIPVRELLPLAARLSAWTRNAEGLRALLEHATGHRVRVLENVPRLVNLTERPRVGQARLGVDAVVGARIHDQSGKFRLEVGPLGRDAFRDLLPGGGGSVRLAALVRLYTSDGLEYDVDLLLKSEEALPMRLGDTQSAQIGRNSMVGAPPPPVVRRRVQYAAA